MESGGGEEEWAAPTSSCVGLGELVDYAQGGVLQKGSRVRVLTRGGDTHDGTVLVYCMSTSTYSVRLDTGEVERDVPRSSITSVTTENGQVLRCWYAGCRQRLAEGHNQEKGHTMRSVAITDKTRAGGRDWARLRGFTLCFTCYVRYIQHGTLAPGGMGVVEAEASGGGKRKAEEEAGREENRGKLSYNFGEGEFCVHCKTTQGRIRRVTSSARAGNRDWFVCPHPRGSRKQPHGTFPSRICLAVAVGS